jgi:glucose/arabinose dehydrogenase
MMRTRSIRALVGALAALSLGAAAASGAPTATSGSPVETLAQGVPTPTQFAFGAGKVFVAAAGDEETSAPGGVFLVHDGVATRIPDTPPTAFGVVWRRGTLYVTSGPRLLALRGWNGTSFDTTKVLFRGPAGMPFLTGLAIGPNRRLYTGVSFSADRFDHERSTEPLGQRLISLRRNGKGLRVVAEGLRQPWMPTFVRGIRNPFVTVLAQDNLAKAPPDWIVRARRGQDYGFPDCTWQKPKACKGFPKPVALLPEHSSPMGIGAIGTRLYVALFGGRSGSPEVVSLQLGHGSNLKPVLTGFAAPVVALGVRRGWIYTGDLSGAIYRVKA